MTKDSQSAQHSPWPLVLFSVTLALALLVLSLLDYARAAGQPAAIATAVVALGLLAFLAIRIYRKERAHLAAPLAGGDEISNRTALIILLGLTLLAAALRLYRLGHESFWYDETFTALWASRPLLTVLRSVNPLPHLVAHLSLALGRSEFILRLGPALAGILLIPSTCLLGRTLYRRTEGLVAAALLTVSAYALYHSQELRFYAWQMLFSTWTLIFLLRGLDGRRWAWVGFALATALNLYSHPFGLFVLASEGLYVAGVALADAFQAHRGLPLGDRRRFAAVARRLLAPAVCALVALAAFGPGWGHLFSLTTSPTWTLDTENTLVAAQGGPWFDRPIATWTYELPSSLLALSHPAWLGLVLVFFFVGLLSSARRQVALVLLWVLVPPIVLFAVKVHFYHRYLSYFLPLCTLVVAHGLDGVASAFWPMRVRRWVALALLTLLVAAPNLAQLPEYYRDAQKEQWREAIAFIESNRQPGDGVLVMSSFIVGAPHQPFDWYRTVPSSELPWQFFDIGADETVPGQWDELLTMVQGHRRVWFVMPASATEIGEAINERLHGRFQWLEERGFVCLQVVLYQAFSE